MKNVIDKILGDRYEVLRTHNIQGECKWFKSVNLDTLDSVIEAFTHPQGVEFCQKYNFPDIRTLRKFKSLNVEDYGIYIDSGDIDISGKSKIVLIGNTRARVHVENGGCDVVIMHRATAKIISKNWSVVNVCYNTNCKVELERLDRSIIKETFTKI